jgi:hypothetical protein
MAIKKGRKTICFTLSFVAVFGSGINIPDPPHCMKETVKTGIVRESCSTE